MNNKKFNFDKFYYAILEEDDNFKVEILENQRNINERLNRIQLDQLLMSYENGYLSRDEFLDKVEKVTSDGE